MAESCHLLKMTSFSCFMNTDSNDLSVTTTTRSAARWIPNQKTKYWNEDSTGSTFGLNLSWGTQTLGLSTMEVSSDTALQTDALGAKSGISSHFLYQKTSHCLHPRAFIVLRKKKKYTAISSYGVKIIPSQISKPITCFFLSEYSQLSLLAFQSKISRPYESSFVVHSHQAIKCLLRAWV